jgi:hypothetical protein
LYRGEYKNSKRIGRNQVKATAGDENRKTVMRTMASCSSRSGSHFVARSAYTRALTRDSDEPASSSSPDINEEDAAVDAAAAAATSALPTVTSLAFDLRNKQREKTKARLSIIEALNDA